ncbi:MULTISPECIES: AraC family transcriptional regulator [Acinetobacter]|uniref:AraC family transcriptional regulator n=1 Tax=Acinetobacter piscicola TaxID=2006115 RepID=A0A4Q4H1R0_9GAMM|nr:MULTISPECIES: AraC family transcriptional regulator [Acinetobacter]QOW46422.1 AraC family transcriptional regulator [Acinetobacter piscicola]RYL27752.1 AraC family transcriptional regulator [Acinetobacter piscicola]
MDNQLPKYSKGTISITLVQEALATAQNKNLDLAQLIQKMGISPELMQSDKSRVSVHTFALLWTEIANQMNDEFFGMDSHAMRRGSFQLLSKMLMQAENVKIALTQILQFLNAILDDFSSTLFVEENYAYIVIYDRQAPKNMFAYATYLMLIHGLICWLSGQRLIINKIQLRCAAPQDDHDYKVRFCENIHYHSDENYIQFDANYLKIAIKQDQKSWYEFIKNTPENLLVRFKNPHALSSIIRKSLMQQSPEQWLELNVLAKQLNMSEATIQRRLKNEGTSYQQLKNEIRRDTAIELLTTTQKTLQEISSELYFQDPSAFHRAFKKWTGVNPGSYRDSSLIF